MALVNSAAALAAAPRKVSLGGEVHEISPLTIADFGRLQAWVDAQLPDPFVVVAAAVASGRYNAAQQQFLMRTAMEIASKPRALIGTAEGDEVLRSVAGIQRLLFVSISKTEAAFTEAAAAALYERISQGDIHRVFNATEVDMALGDPPKATTDGETPPTTTATS